MVVGRRLSSQRLLGLLSIAYLIVLYTSVVLERSLSRQLELNRYAFLQGKVRVHSVQENKKDTSHTETLALLAPPGLVGGYRNQVIRLVSLVKVAQVNDIDQLLLPSILFSTTYKGHSNKMFMPIPMDEVFDVSYWNSFQKDLPFLVPFIKDGDCWSKTTTTTTTNETVNSHDREIDLMAMKYNSSIKRVKDPVFKSPMTTTLLNKDSFLSPLLNISKALLNGEISIDKPRKLDLMPLVQNCSHPFVHGGGKGAGRLWNDYSKMPKYDPTLKTNTREAIENSKLINLVSQALRPAEQWRKVADQCILHHQKGSKQMAPYAALHARVEVAMMNHRCGKKMEKNLTNIFSMVDNLVEEHNTKMHNKNIEGIFVAVSREGMLEKTKDTNVTKMTKHNYKTLLQRTQDNDKAQIPGGQIQPVIFECGELWMEKWYSTQNELQDDYYGSLIPSVLNFYIATKASIFVGVAGSSWSTDVWTARFHEGKGDTNLMYTKTEGIIPVPNGGLPTPHDNCKTKKKNNVTRH